MTFFDFIAPVYEKLHWGSEKTYNKLTALVNFKLSDVIADIGGGTGRIAKLFVHKVKSVTVVDPSENMANQCRRHSGLSCIVSGAEKLPFADNTIDKIILVDAFHHIPDQIKAVREMHRVIKKNGQIILEEFNPLTIGGKWVILIEEILRMGSKFYNPVDLVNFFRIYGFNASIFDEGKKTYYVIAEKR